MAKASRQAFGEALLELGRQNERIVALDADLSKSTMSMLFAKEFPQRFFEMGIAEANMIGVGSGMALAGKIPFVCSFACFITGRYDQIRMSAAYTEAPLRIVGTHAGVGIGEDGNSQMGLEDIALMRALPNMTVLQPADENETKQAVAWMAQNDAGPSYIRLTRQKLPDVHDAGFQFQVGKADRLRDGKDITIFATGGTVAPALDAHQLLAERGISARVVNVCSIKPIDIDTIVQCAGETNGLFTVEDHNIIGGMGSAVCEVVAEHAPVPVKRWGLLDCFGQSGTPEELYAYYKLDGAGIADAAEAFAQSL